MDHEKVLKLIEEAKAFDAQIDERISNGHIPDLRNCKPCDWFENNPWRRPAYVELSFGEQFSLIRDAINEHVENKGREEKVRILEVGCGPGYLSLELSRSGFDVTGLDLSSKCIEVAECFAAKDDEIAVRGGLRYVVADFFDAHSLTVGSFDAVVFLGSMHHFSDIASVLDHVSELLKSRGIIIAHEPVRDRVTHGNAVFVSLLRVLLSLQGGFFKKYTIPVDADARKQEFERLFSEMRYESSEGENFQSVNDNEAGYAEMRPALDAQFDLLEFSWRYAFFHEFIGGLRFNDHQNIELASYLREIDRELCRLGVLSATEFFYVGRKFSDR